MVAGEIQGEAGPCSGGRNADRMNSGGVHDDVYEHGWCDGHVYITDGCGLGCNGHAYSPHASCEHGWATLATCMAGFGSYFAYSSAFVSKQYVPELSLPLLF